MADIFDTLTQTIAARRGVDPATSYVARLLDGGPPLAARKLGEEAIETVIAALTDTPAALVAEAADLIFHLQVVLATRGVDLDMVRAELVRREGVSGHVEKAGRPG